MNFEQFCETLYEARATQSLNPFKPIDYSKHDFKYPVAVINDLLDGKSVTLTDGSSITIDDFDKDALVALKNNITNSTVSDLNKTYKNNVRSIWSNIHKRPYSKSSVGEKVPGSEAAVLVYIDMIAQNHDVDDIGGYKPSKRIHTDQKYIDDAINVITTNKSWRLSALQTAKNLLEKLPQLKNYHIYYRDNNYDNIRATANKLGDFGGSLDRWNPADVFFAKQGAVPIKSEYTGNIADYNSYIGACDDVIGVSLKKADNHAIHGSVGLGKMLTKLPQIKMSLQKYKSVPETFSTVHKQLKTIADSPLASIVKCIGVDSDIHKRIVDEDQSDVKLNNGTFINAVPNVLQFIVSGCRDVDLFADTIQMCYMWAASRTPLSCNHYKASATGCKLIDCKTGIDFKLNQVIIPLNGNARIVFDITVDGNNWSLVGRAKEEGAFPQFMIEHKKPATAGAVPIKRVKL